MTVVLGFSTSGGVVLATDSQMTDEDEGVKHGGSQKIHQIRFKGAESALLTRAGSIEGSDAFQEIFAEMAANTIVSGPRVIADVAESALVEARRRIVKSVSDSSFSESQREQRLRDTFHRLLLAYTYKRENYIFTAESKGAMPVRVSHPFIAIGSGKNIAAAELEEINVASMSIGEGTGLAAFVIDTCKKSDLFCSGDIQIGIATTNGSVYVFGSDMANVVQTLVDGVRKRVRGSLVEQISTNFDDFPIPDDSDPEMFAHLFRMKAFKESAIRRAATDNSVQ